MARWVDGQISRGDDIIGLSELNVDLTKYLTADNGSFVMLMPYTTTFVKFRVNRDPTLDPENRPKVCN